MLRHTFTSTFRGSHFVNSGFKSSFAKQTISTMNTSKTMIVKPNSINNVTVRGFRSGKKLNQQSYTTTSSTGANGSFPLIVGAVGVTGLAGLAFYGYTQSEVAPTENYVATRLRYTYLYMMSSLGIAGASAYTFFRSGLAHRMATMSPWLTFGASLAALFGTQMMTHAIPYENGFAKHLAWGAFCTTLGAVICPVVAVGGTILAQAAAATGAVVGSLSLISAAAPTGTFLNIGGPLSIGLGILIAASFGSIMFPASGLLASFITYGGTALFGFFVLHDTQKINHDARHSPRYDPINSCMGLVMSTVNIFLNMVNILSSRNRK